MTRSQFGASHICLTQPKVGEQSAFPSPTTALFAATGDTPQSTVIWQKDPWTIRTVHTNGTITIQRVEITKKGYMLGE